MKNLLISGNTLQEWNVQEILTPTKSNEFLKDELALVEIENTIARNGLTYLEIMQLDNQFNNF